MSEIIISLFVAIIFFLVAFGIIVVGLISLFGFVRAMHRRQFNEMFLYLLIFTFVYTGTSHIGDMVTESGVQMEVSTSEKEQFIHQLVFADENIAIERTDTGLTDGHSFYVMQESDNQIFRVDVLDEKAFGLYRYHVEPFNSDERLSEKETP